MRPVRLSRRNASKSLIFETLLLLKACRPEKQIRRLQSGWRACGGTRGKGNLGIKIQLVLLDTGNFSLSSFNTK